eukprot:COSAG01_NODE_2633_length_7333_cov_89.156760_13_plen_132_part_00
MHDWSQAARSSAHARGVLESQVQISRGMEQVWFKEYRFSQVPQHSQRAPIDVHIHPSPCGSPAQYGLCTPPRWQHLLVLSPRVYSVPPPSPAHIPLLSARKPHAPAPRSRRGRANNAPYAAVCSSRRCARL